MPLIGRPSLGSWVAYGLGSENDSLPSYVVMLDKRGETANVSVRSPYVLPRDLEAMGAQIILGNTFHLWLRPGLDVLRTFGGLRRFGP